MKEMVCRKRKAKEYNIGLQNWNAMLWKSKILRGDLQNEYVVVDGFPVMNIKSFLIYKA